MPQRRASSSTVGGVLDAATAFSSTMARPTLIQSAVLNSGLFTLPA
jgi:hypothetical protein